jgi:hypothetical protein
VLKGTFSKPMPDGKGGTIAPTGKAFALDMATVGIWNRQGTMDEEFFFRTTRPSTPRWAWADPLGAWTVPPAATPDRAPDDLDQTVPLLASARSGSALSGSFP